jgi:hypothetical protein
MLGGLDGTSIHYIMIRSCVSLLVSACSLRCPIGSYLPSYSLLKSAYSGQSLHVVSHCLPLFLCPVQDQHLKGLFPAYESYGKLEQVTIFLHSPGVVHLESIRTTYTEPAKPLIVEVTEMTALSTK